MPATTWIRNLTVALTFLCVGGGAGAWLADGHGVPDDVASFSAQAFLNAVDQRDDRARLTADIFARNLSVYILLLAGLISGGLTTVVTLAFNGVLLGQMFGVASLMGVPVAAPIWLLAPHGILELSLFLLAAAIGLQGPAVTLAFAAGKELAWRPRRLRRMALVGVPALAVAALIEGYLTLPIAQAALLP